MLPYSAIDYAAAYQSRPGNFGGSSAAAAAAAFTHSWLVPSSQEVANFSPNQQPPLDTGHVFVLLFYLNLNTLEGLRGKVNKFKICNKGRCWHDPLVNIREAYLKSICLN
jgi:hypothetical protein